MPPLDSSRQSGSKQISYDLERSILILRFDLRTRSCQVMTSSKWVILYIITCVWPRQIDCKWLGVSIGSQSRVIAKKTAGDLWWRHHDLRQTCDLAQHNLVLPCFCARPLATWPEWNESAWDWVSWDQYLSVAKPSLTCFNIRKKNGISNDPTLTPRIPIRSRDKASRTERG